MKKNPIVSHSLPLELITESYEKGSIHTKKTFYLEKKSCQRQSYLSLFKEQCSR